MRVRFQLSVVYSYTRRTGRLFQFCRPPLWRYNKDMEVIANENAGEVVQNPANICPQDIIERLTVVPVSFYSFDDREETGSVVIDRDLAGDIEELFALMLREKFPIRSVVPISDVRFDWDDERSMQANNTSVFNYRFIAGTAKLSNHARGRAIDINPLFNPFIKGDFIQPKGAVYDPSRAGTIATDSFIVAFLKARGWTWGGDWTDRKDYQHFEKP